MSGYTPVFDTVFQGSLCGRYPDTAAWLFLLALADKNGVVDMTPQYISSVTGMPVTELLGCIERFLEPDPYSRSSASQGRRLELIDPDRQWGWRIVNHGKYREKARLQSKNAREVAEGKNKARMKDRRRPPETAPDPPSNANANAGPPGGGQRARASRRVPADFVVDDRLRDWNREKLGLPDSVIEYETEKFRDHEFKTARKDWRGTWRNWMRRAQEQQDRAADSRNTDSFDEIHERNRRAAGLD